MLNLPIYSRNGIYYLHIRIDGHQFKKSLKTKNPDKAKLLGLKYLEIFYVNKPKLSDFNFNTDAIKRYEIEMGGMRIKADSAEDHLRALQTIAQLQKFTTHTSPSVSAESVSGVPTALTLNELLDKYLLMKDLASGSVPSAKRAMKEFSEFSKAKTIDKVLKSDATRFAEHLKKEGKALQTVETKFNLLKAMFNFAREYSYLRSENPFNLKIMTKAQKLAASYNSFDDEQIVEIFKAKYFESQKIRDPDYFWVCIIGVLTGIRIGAITALQKNEIKKTESGVHYIKIIKDKTPGGIRDVPIIPELFEMGFAEFLNKKTDAIFEYKITDEKGGSNAPSKKFSNRLIALGIKTPKLVFHSLRGFANNFYAKNGIMLEARCQFFGHDIENINIDRYTKPYTHDELFELVAPQQRRILAKLCQA